MIGRTGFRASRQIRKRNLYATPPDANDIVGFVQPASTGRYRQDAFTGRISKPHSTGQTSPANERANYTQPRRLIFTRMPSAEAFALLAREAGKTLADAVAEMREAVDFLRYYAARSLELTDQPRACRFACISPWNFPLAIFTGQIAAALAAGNAVLAKPAEATPLIATFGVRLMHEAGVPRHALQLLPGHGSVVGAATLTSDPRIDGVCFTGSTATAQRINRTMADHIAPTAPLIAETGGLNAMIVDSTALPEQAIKDILDSSFRSAGQRCSGPQDALCSGGRGRTIP